MNQPRLSILIPSIPSRWEMARKLYGSLLTMSEGKDIEIIMLTDNKIMSIGEKHNQLKAMAHGKYFCFLHDDDELMDLSAIYEATALEVDVIDFKARCRNEDGSTYLVTQQLGNLVEHRVADGRYLDMKRPPWTNCVWLNKFKKFDFAHINYGEDWTWIEQCLKEARTEHFINQVLFSYNFDSRVTEASTDSNSHWKNPNP